MWKIVRLSKNAQTKQAITHKCTQALQIVERKCRYVCTFAISSSFSFKICVNDTFYYGCQACNNKESSFGPNIVSSFCGGGGTSGVVYIYFLLGFQSNFTKTTYHHLSIICVHIISRQKYNITVRVTYYNKLQST